MPCRRGIANHRLNLRESRCQPQVQGRLAPAPDGLRIDPRVRKPREHALLVQLHDLGVFGGESEDLGRGARREYLVALYGQRFDGDIVIAERVDAAPREDQIGALRRGSRTGDQHADPCEHGDACQHANRIAGRTSVKIRTYRGGRHGRVVGGDRLSFINCTRVSHLVRTGWVKTKEIDTREWEI